MPFNAQRSFQTGPVHQVKRGDTIETSTGQQEVADIARIGDWVTIKTTSGETIEADAHETVTVVKNG